MKLEVHTLRYGNPEWLQRCAPTLNAWCARHQLELHVWSDQTGIAKGYSNPKFAEVDMLCSFLEGGNEQMIYIDADIYVHPDTPAPVFGPGMHIRPHGRRVNNPFWLPWCHEHFGEGPLDGGCYRNAGVWVIDRESARLLLSVIQPPYIEGIMEQNHFNWWMMTAEQRELQIHDLAPEWNAFPMELEHAWFFHLYGHNKMQRLGFFERKGLIPRAAPRATQRPPTTMTRNLVTTKPSRRPAHEPTIQWPMFMDQLHLDLLAKLLHKHRPKTVMEIGSFKGVSTQVFLDALETGVIERLIIVEPSITPELKARIDRSGMGHKVRIETQSSWEILEPVDFVLIDGDHRWPAFADLAQALALRVPVIAMHDTASMTAGIKSCHGSEQAFEILKACPNREWFEDKEKRAGMWTERGFGWSAALVEVGACKSDKKHS